MNLHKHFEFIILEKNDGEIDGWKVRRAEREHALIGDGLNEVMKA